MKARERSQKKQNSRKRKAGLKNGIHYLRRSPQEIEKERSWGDHSRRGRAVSNGGMGLNGVHRTDARILEDIREALTVDDGLDASGITVVVVAGEAELSGRVKLKTEKGRAAELAESVAGVTGVANLLRVNRDKKT